MHREGVRPTVLPQTMGPGVAFRDLDGDGLADLVFVQGAGERDDLAGAALDTGRPRFTYLRNMGDGTFADATAASGLDVSGWGMGVLAADLDNDGDQDLVFTFYGKSPAAYENLGDGTFRPFTKPLPPDERGGQPFGTGLCAFDAFGSGMLSVYALGYVEVPRSRIGTQSGGVAIKGNWQPRGLSPYLPLARPSQFFENRGGLVFRERAREVGLANAQAKGLAALTVPGDAGCDLFVANDVTPCALFHRVDGRYEDQAVAAWVAEVAGSMGLALCDYDHDGQLDVFCARWVQENHALYRANRRRDGARYFTNMAQITGLADLGTDHVGWGCAFLDVDGDGWEDLVVLEGHTYVDETHLKLVPQPPLVLLSQGGQRFVRLPAEPGSLLATPLTARGAAFADYDNDGAVDVAIAQNRGPARLWHATPPPGHWVGLELSGSAGNRDAVGAVVRVTAGPLKLTHALTSGDSYLSTSSPRLIFRIAGETSAKATVTWPDGRVLEVPEVALDHLTRVVEP